MFFHHFFLKADRAKFSANPSLVQQNLTHYRSKVISKFPQSESNMNHLETLILHLLISLKHVVLTSIFFSKLQLSI
jgi:hypothetical protein